jgi:hypothetical protein
MEEPFRTSVVVVAVVVVEMYKSKIAEMKEDTVEMLASRKIRVNTWILMSNALYK